MTFVRQGRSAIATALLASAALLGGTAAKAGLVVDYSTAGTFTGNGSGYTGNGTSTIQFGTGSHWTRIAFTGVDDLTPAINSGSTLSPRKFGSFAVTRGANGGGHVDITFNLTITQGLPSDGSVQFSAPITGRIQGNDTLLLTFTSPHSKSISFSNYLIDGQEQDGLVTYSVPSTNITMGANSTKQLDGSIGVTYSPSAPGSGSTTVTPEPGTLALALTGLIPLGIAGMRRFRHRQAGN